MAELRTTKAGAYIEVEGSGVIVSAFGPYIEYEGTSVIVSAFGVYVEYDLETTGQIDVTQFGAYAELQSGSALDVTQFGAYAEVEPIRSAFVTRFGVYADISGKATKTTKFGTYADISGAVVQITRFGVYADISAEPPPYVRITQAGAYVEIAGHRLVLTQAGAYVEITRTRLLMTQAGAYIEIWKPPAMPTYFPRNAGTRRMHTIIPEQPTGYAFDPEFSFWSIIVPEATENLVINPAMYQHAALTTTYSSGAYYNFTVTYPDDAPVGSTRGVYCAKLVKASGGGVGSRAEFIYTGGPSDLNVTPGPYTFSIDIYATVPGSVVYLKITDDTIPPGETIIAESSYRVESSGWNRIHLSYVELGTAVRWLKLVVEDADAADGTIFYTSAWQFEAKAYPTTYADGDMVDWNDKEYGQSYRWKGNPNYSISIRAKTAGSGGKVVSFSDICNFLTTSIIGLGMNPVDNESLDLASGVTLPLGTVDKSRTFSIVGVVGAPHYDSLLEQRNELIKLIRHNNRHNFNGLVLRYQTTLQHGKPYGMPLEIICSYKDGLQGNIVGMYQERLSLQFEAVKPFLKERIESARVMTPITEPADNRLIYRDENGVYQNLGVGATNGTIYQTTFDKDANSQPVVGGSFTNLCGSAVAGVGRWNGSAWEQVGNGFDTNNGVKAFITESPFYVPALGGKEFIIAGAFQLDAGDDQTRGLARLDRTLNEWQKIGRGLGDGVLGPTCMAVAPDGVIYVGGTFVDYGDTGSTLVKRIAKLTYSPFSRTVLPLLGGLNDTVHTILVGNDEMIYIGGDFDFSYDVMGVQDVDLNFVGYWNPKDSTFNAMDQGLSGSVSKLFYGPDGYIWAVGAFDTNFQTTVDLEGIARWNGTKWERVLELNIDPLANGIGNYAVVDKNNITWFSFGSDVVQDSGYYQFGRWAKTFGWKNGIFYPPEILSYSPSGDVIAHPWYHTTYSGNGLEALIIVYDLSGVAYLGYIDWDPVVPYTLAVDYYGTANADISLVVTGKTSFSFVRNEINNAGIYFDSDFESNYDEVLIYTNEGFRRRLLSSRRSNMTGKIDASISSPGRFVLMPGRNYISLFLPKPDDDLQCSIVWHNSYYSVDASLA